MKTGICLLVWFFIVCFHGWLPLWKVKRKSGCEMQLGFFCTIAFSAPDFQPVSLQVTRGEWMSLIGCSNEREWIKERKKKQRRREEEERKKLRTNKKRNDERQNVRINRWKKVIKWNLICKWKREWINERWCY